MNDTINTLVDLDMVPVEITDVRIIEGNDTDGETNVIHVAPETEDVPVSPTIH